MPWALIITLAITLIEKGPAAIKRSVDALRRSGMLTAEESAAFDARIDAALASDAWKTDEQLADGGAPPAGPADPAVREAIDGTPPAEP